MSQPCEIVYAREVYAACLTVGFVDEHVEGLKPLLDAESHGPEQLAELMALARAAQAASVRWASRRAMPPDTLRGENRDG